MARLAISQKTIKKERSISSTTWYYLLQPSSASAPDSTNYGNPPPTITTEGYSGWSTAEPTYTIGDNRVLYQMVQTVFSDDSFKYTAPTISSSYEAAKAAYSEVLLAEADIEELQDLGLHHGYIWTNQTAKSASGSIPAYPVGSYIASGINNTINQANSNTYGLNTWISTGGINLRYNAIDLAKLTTSTLEFYYPSTSSQGTAAISLGTHSGINSLIFYEFGSTNKKMELTGSNLNFYGSSQSTPDAQLTSTGLNIVNGSIELANDTNNSIKISNNNFTRSINSISHDDLRMAIGDKFGVASDGSFYASNANIKGIVNATSGFIGQDTANGFTISNSAIYNPSTKHTLSSDTEDGIYLGKDGIALGQGTFKVTSAGALTAKSGTIGGWTIGNTFLSTTSTGTPGANVITLSKGIAGPTAATGILPANQTWAFTASNQFGVTTAGKLYASGADISGKITATEGTIGGASISNGTLIIKDANIESISGSKIAANTITIGNIASDTQSQILNSAVNIDTRNYWRAIDSSKRTIGVSRVTYTYDGEGTYVLTCNNASTSGYAQIYTSEWFDATDLAGKTVIFHAESITTTNSSAADRVYLAMQNASGQGLTGQFLSSSNLSKVITLPTSLAKMQLIIRMDQNKAHAVGDVMTVVKPKLEIGYQATGWTQAPEDVDADIADSAKVATNYIYASSSGIRIASANPKSQNQRLELTSSDAIFYDSSGVQRVGINASNGVIIGRTNKGRTVVTDAGLQIYDTNNKKRAVVDSDGLNVYDTDGSTSVALFSASARIGKAAASHVDIAPNSISMSVLPTDMSQSTSNLLEIFKVKQIPTTNVQTFACNESFANGDGPNWYQFVPNRVISSWSKVTVRYKINQGSAQSQIYTGFPIDDSSKKISIVFNYDEQFPTDLIINYGRGNTATSSETITIVDIQFEYISSGQIMETTLGAHFNSDMYGPFRIGNGTSANAKSNAALINWRGDGYFGGDIRVNCNSDSTGGISLSVPENAGNYSYDRTDGDAQLTIDGYRVGKVVSLVISGWSMFTTAAGGNIFNNMNLTSSGIPKPIDGYATGGTYYGNHAVMMLLYVNTDDKPETLRFTMRNASSSSIQPTGEIHATITYLTEE